MEKLFAIKQAAELIDVHPETLRRWDREGNLVAVKINERGDRRYRESDILEFMSTHKTTISHAKSVDIDGYKIRWWREKGFQTVARNFHLIAKLYAVKDKELIGFAFFVDFFNKAKSGINEGELDKLVMEKITEYFKSKKVFDGDIVTFEFFDSTFLEVQNPEWWEEKYGKTLVAGLRIEAHTTYPAPTKYQAWRVILHFKSKKGGIWVTNTFGPNHEFSEYFVWTSSEELARRDLPNTAKGAEILAINYGIERFEKTKKNGDRNITRISENNAACYEGKCVKDGLLPNKLMN